MKFSRLAAVLVSFVMLYACGTSKEGIKQQGKAVQDTIKKKDTIQALQFKEPVKDFRAVWIATIGGLDWPRGHFDEKSQKALYKQYLDTLQKLNINTVLFQIRPRADAFYESKYEPWSMYLTWQRDMNPGYDVLQWLIDETHQRGMAFHAWMNPYRIGTRKNRKDKFAPLDSRIPKSWVKDYATVRVYNPALKETRQRICDIVRDLLLKFDVDGIHFDDYFYPALSKGEKMNDGREYKLYGKNYTSIEDFRRAMVDSLVLSVKQTILKTKPNVVFTIAPQGNYDNNFNVMFADVAQWSRRGWVDMVIPQLYWSTEKYFPARLKWFADSCARHSKLAIGYALYRFDGKSHDPYFQTADDLTRQLRLAYSNGKVAGSVLYSAHWLIDNPLNINDVIKKQFPYPTLPPYLGQEPETKPSTPKNAIMTDYGKDSVKLSWLPIDNCYYAVYSNNKNIQGFNELVGITYSNEYITSKGNLFYITAVRKGDNAESEPICCKLTK